MQLTAVVNPSGRGADSAGPPVQHFRSLTALVESQLAGAVYIASPNHLHAAQTIQCLDAGLDVLCEKPMAISSGECRSMIDAARTAGRHLQVGHMLRFSPALRQIRERVAGGMLGQVSSASATLHYELPVRLRPWAADIAIAGGGALLDAGIHCLDTLRWMFGQLSPVAASLQRTDPSETEVAATALLRAGEVECTVDVDSRRPYRSVLEIRGTDGTMTAENFAAGWGLCQIEVTRSGKVVECVTADQSEVYREQLIDFVNAVRRRDTALASATEAAECVAVVEDLYQVSRGVA